MKAIIGFGNLLREDDGVGIRIIHRLQTLSLSRQIRFFEGHPYVMDSLFEHEEFDKLIIVDSVMTNRDEGIIHRIPMKRIPSYRINAFQNLHTDWLTHFMHHALASPRDYSKDIIFLGMEIKHTEPRDELCPVIMNRIPLFAQVILQEATCTF